MREFLEKYGLRLLIITTVCAVLISVLSFVSATSGFLQNAVGVLTYPFRSAVTAVAAATQWMVPFTFLALKPEPLFVSGS